MTGDEAKEQFSVLTPHIDADERFKEITSLKENISKRGLEIEVEKIQTLWNMLKQVEKDKVTLENKRVDIANKIKQLKGSGENSVKEMDKLKLQGKLLRDDLKTTTKAVWELEKLAIPRILNLPNDLHVRTPSSENIIFEVGKEATSKITESHVDIGKSLGILDCINSEWFYTKGHGAIFELGMLDYFANEIFNQNFIKFCNSDFSRSVVVEGCGINHEDPTDTFILKDTDDMLEAKDVNRLHLVGGTSFISFCAFHAKNIIPTTSLPLQLFAVGRHYTPNNQNGSNLFNTCQSTSVGLFILTSNQNSEIEEFDKCVAMITEIYKTLGYPFRIVYLPAKNLKKYESLKASIQMFSPYFGSYIEVGHICMCGSYISKRLLIRHGTEEDMKFTHVISGSAVSIPKLLGCLLEQYHYVNDFVDIPVPDEVKKYFVK
ncbi:hypothetical protein L9F63_007609 [Diploptera punctata]|uniref:Aminoacyl-tRNA synthetase class II (G/ P/ S/T) domain-containing protein n=1 Tax=Diploptera punctata TaxID=6984 RepID=A0AAD7Z7L4_DIPPU|nr:hypothetical protein L9F63_007609 [Diploptera punctata]